MTISRDDLGSEGNNARRLFWEKCASRIPVDNRGWETPSDVADWADTMLVEWDKRWIAQEGDTKCIELPEGYRVLRSYFARVHDYGVIPHRSAKEAEERAQDDGLNSRLELRVVILDPTGTKTDTAILWWKLQSKKNKDAEDEDITQANEILP